MRLPVNINILTKLKTIVMSTERLREEYIEKGANPDDVDDTISKAEHNNLNEDETRNELDRTIGKS
jgi:hypothetical protein